MKRIALSIALALAATPAFAHPTGGPAVAWPNDPYNAGTVADEEFTFTWVDSNFLNTSTTGTITIDWYYTQRMPATFQLGVTPSDLEGTPIVLGVPEEDRTDAYTWDTRNVPSGAYWIYSRVNDLPGETSLKIVAFSRAPLTIAHAQDAPHPHLAIVQPNSPFVIADEQFRVIFEAFDPAGDGRVKLEAMQNRDGSDAITIADNIPATETGTVTWDTRALEEGDWIVKGTITDGQNRTFTAYSRFLLRIEHLLPIDAGPRPDSGRLDSGLFYDGGVGAEEATDTEGCSCNTQRSKSSAFGSIILLAAWMLVRTRSAGSARRAARSRSDFLHPRE